MSRKDELLKLAKLFHSQASRTGTPDENRGCLEWANTIKTKPPTRRIATLTNNGHLNGSIATPSGLRKRASGREDFVWVAVAYSLAREVALVDQPPRSVGEHDARTNLFREGRAKMRKSILFPGGGRRARLNPRDVQANQSPAIFQ
jgi:hypothetical protein